MEKLKFAHEKNRVVARGGGMLSIDFGSQSCRFKQMGFS